MFSRTSATIRLRNQSVQFTDNSVNFGFQGRLIACRLIGCAAFGALGQALFDTAQRALDAADGEAGFVEIEFHATGVAAPGEGCNRLSAPKCA